MGRNERGGQLTWMYSDAVPSVHLLSAGASLIAVAGDVAVSKPIKLDKNN